MAKTASFLSVAGIDLVRNSDTPLHRQLYEQLRALIWSGRLAPGTRLPPTRALSSELGLSRSTVVEAILQLASEGYVVGRQGAGTYVSADLPEPIFPTGLSAVHVFAPASAMARLSQRGEKISNLPAREVAVPTPFLPGLPETRSFPFGIWRKLLNRHWHTPSSRSLGYPTPGGYQPLREAIANHVATTRGVRCTPAQVIITTGTQQALNLTMQLLTDPGDKAWIENPGYGGARVAMRLAGVEMVPVSLDESGLKVDEGIARAPEARLVYVTPSHQYPAGFIMSLARRRQLLQWSRENEVWILEDDYDSEYRFAGHPLASLQALDEGGCVLYSGTFSKILFPGLRLGYIIVPPALAEPFKRARDHFDRGTSELLQKVLYDFMQEGHLARHIRRMRTLYMSRQAALVEALAEHCGAWLTVRPAPAGLHLIGWLEPAVDDQLLSRQMADEGINVPALSSYSIAPLGQGGLVMGYAGIDEGEIRAAVRQMARVKSRDSVSAMSR